jgi:hypothetical protein
MSKSKLAAAAPPEPKHASRMRFAKKTSSSPVASTSRGSLPSNSLQDVEDHLKAPGPVTKTKAKAKLTAPPEPKPSRLSLKTVKKSSSLVAAATTTSVDNTVTDIFLPLTVIFGNEAKKAVITGNLAISTNNIGIFVHKTSTFKTFKFVLRFAPHTCDSWVLTSLS